MAQNLTNADAILKEFYVDKIVEAIKQEMPLSDYFKRRDDMPSDGRRVVYPVHVARNSGRGARGESGNLPTAGNQTWQDLQIPYKYNHARIQLSAQILKASKTSKGAFEKAFDAEIMGAAKDLGRDRNRQLFGFGNGQLCQISGSVAASTTVNVTACQGIAGVPGTYNPARFIAAGDLLAAVTPGGALDATAGIITVASVAANLQSFTATASFSTATANCILVRASTVSDTLNSTAYANEIMGLLGMNDDGTYVNVYNNINRSTYPIFQSYRLDLGGGSLSSQILQKAWDGVDQRGNGKITACFMHQTTLREHLATLLNFKRYNNEFAMAPDSGWKGAAHDGEIEFNEAPLLVDRDAPYGTIFGLDESTLVRYVLEEGKWADEDGTILLRLSGSDDYEARFRVFDNFLSENPNHGFVVSTIGLTTPPETIQVI